MSTPIFYNEKQNVSGLESYSPSAGKPKRFVELMAHFRFHDYGPHAIGIVEPVTKEDLYRVHDKKYVDEVFSGAQNNGFENSDPRVPESCLWTCGSLLSGARHALKYPPFPICSPTSGFHHAGHDFGGGYCTFNGLMVAAAKLINENPKMKIGIVDLDMHAGNGTTSILKKHKDLAKRIIHHSSGEHWYGKEDPDEWFLWLQEVLESVNAFKPDLVIYQAGADLHIKDPLGGILDDAQMAQRDRMVFNAILAPIVFNLAGGYQKRKDKSIFADPVLAIHRATMKASDASIQNRKNRK